MLQRLTNAALGMNKSIEAGSFQETKKCYLLKLEDGALLYSHKGSIDIKYYKQSTIGLDLYNKPWLDKPEKVILEEVIDQP